MKHILMVIANQNFQDFEYRIPREALEEAGHKIDVAAETTGTCIWVFGHETFANIALADAKGTDYDAVIFVGGGWAYQQYLKHPEYLRLATEAKILGAICIAPSLISDSGILNGKNVTGRDDEEGTWTAYMTNNGAIVHDIPAITDGDVITANGPQSARLFAQRLIEHLK